MESNKYISLDLRIFFLSVFPNMKKWFAAKRFQSNEDVIAETKVHFEVLSKSYFLDVFKI